eukprot:4743414-Pleurochrysis_carterae.AAC.1
MRGNAKGDADEGGRNKGTKKEEILGATERAGREHGKQNTRLITDEWNSPKPFSGLINFSQP